MQTYEYAGIRHNKLNQLIVYVDISLQYVQPKEKDIYRRISVVSILPQPGTENQNTSISIQLLPV